MADTDLIERMNRISAFLRTMHEMGSLAFKKGTAPFDTIDEAATALAEKDARIAELDAECQQSMLDICRERERAEKAESDLTASRAECEGLRAALTECALLSGLDNELIEGASVVVTARMAEIHQHSSAALSQKETGNAA